MYYFAYGMNTNREHMAVRAPRARCVGPAKLLNYRFRFAHHADIVPERYSSVQGLLWKITDECRRSLDQLEGYPDYYNVCEVDVFHNGELYVAEAYFMNPGNLDDWPSNYYLQSVLDGYRQHGIPTTQIEQALKRIDSDNLSVDYYGKL